MMNRDWYRVLPCLTMLLVSVQATAADIPTLLPTLPNYDIPFHGKGSFAPTPDGRLYFETEGIGPPLVLPADRAHLTTGFTLGLASWLITLLSITLTSSAAVTPTVCRPQILIAIPLSATPAI